MKCETASSRIDALTQLGLAASDYLAVGDEDGFVILPPRALLAEWARDTLAGRSLAE